MELLIRNGIVYDPTNGINGEVVDIAVRDGKIVEKIDESKATVIDASKKIVMAGGVDIHSHIAGPKVNLARMLRPEDHYKDLVKKTKVARAGTGYSIPTTFTTGYRYAMQGYTTVFEPANPPMKMLHVHDELNDTPIVDKGCFPVFGNNWFVMEYLAKGQLEECAAYVAWTLTAVKGYAMKIVDPGSVEDWKWGGGIDSLDQQVPRFGITPREIVRGLCKVNKLLNLPHPIHVHANMLGTPGNYQTSIDTMEAVKDLAEDGRPTFHLAHAQFNGYGGVDWPSIASGAEELSKYVNNNKHITIDMGQVIFSDTTTMTADGPFEYKLQGMTGGKWINSDIEVETGSGIVPMHYKRSNYAHAVMWATGLELALMVEDPWRIFLSTDHPNGGPFTEYPRVISWLMSKKARERVTKNIPRLARVRTNITSIDREYSFQEIATISRAATAKILGLKDKGHLGVGADADIAIYSINPKEIDPANDYKQVRKALASAAYTIKNGDIVIKDGEVSNSAQGKTFWTNSKVREDLSKAVVSELASKFDEYYTVKMANYQIPESYLAGSRQTTVQSVA